MRLLSARFDLTTYREGNKATYRPDWDHNRVIETVWWLMPMALCLTISVDHFCRKSSPTLH